MTTRFDSMASRSNSSKPSTSRATSRTTSQSGSRGTGGTKGTSRVPAKRSTTAPKGAVAGRAVSAELQERRREHWLDAFGLVLLALAIVSAVAEWFSVDAPIAHAAHTAAASVVGTLSILVPVALVI